MTEHAEPVRLVHPSGATAEVLVHHGAILNRLEFASGEERLSLIEPMDTAVLPSAWGELRGVPVMFPFPGRVKDARYTALGRTHGGLPVNDPNLPGNHLHGLVAALPWRLLERSTTDCTSRITHDDLPASWQEAYPFAFDLRMRHSLSADKLRMEVRVENPGDGALPFGLGFHPYFSLPLAERGHRAENGRVACSLQLPADQYWPQRDYMPVGGLEPVPPDLDLNAPKRIGDLFGDPPNSVYNLPQVGRDAPAATLRDPFSKAALEIRLVGTWRAMVLFRPPDGPSICVEPQTCVPNAVNLHPEVADTGWLELPAGETWSGAVEFRVVGR